MVQANPDQNSDHARLCIYQGKEKLRPWSKFLGRENSDHGLNFGLPRGGGRSCLRGAFCDQFSNTRGPLRGSRVATTETIANRKNCCDFSALSLTLAAKCEIPPSYRAIPFRDSIAEGGIAPICLVFIGCRARIAEIPFLRGGYRTSSSHALHRGNAQKRGRGYRTQLAMLRHQ